MEKTDTRLGWLTAILVALLVGVMIFIASNRHPKPQVHNPALHQPAAASQAPAKTVTPAPKPQTAVLPAKPDFVVVKRGDTLAGIAKAHGTTWKALCELNKLPSCDRIRPGQKIWLKAAVPAELRTKKAPAPRAHKRQAPKSSIASIDIPAGYKPYRNVGGAPLKGCGDPEEILEEAARAIGLSDEDRKELAELRAKGEATTETISVGTRFSAVTFCKDGHAVNAGKMIAAWDPSKFPSVTAKVYTLGSGLRVRIIDLCGNLALVEEALAPPPPAPPIPPVEAPPELTAPPPALPPAPPEKKPDCTEWKLVLGVESEPMQEGDYTLSGYAAGGYYPICKQGKKGMHRFGVGVQGSIATGTVNDGAGQFDANYGLVGPAYIYESQEGWDIGLKLLAGKLKEKFHQGDYHSEREFGLMALALELNDYRRFMNNKMTLPERQVFALCGIPTSRRTEHWWQNQPISDKASLEEFNFLCSVGVRQYLVARKNFWTYLQAGLFAEDPTSLSASIRLGITDSKKRVGVGVGPDFDLKQGGVNWAIGGWVDVRQVVKVWRANQRAKQAKLIYERSLNGQTATDTGGHAPPVTVPPAQTPSAHQEASPAPSD